MLLPPVSMGISRGVQLFIWLLMIVPAWMRSSTPRCLGKCRAVLQYCEPLTGRCSACSLRCAMDTPNKMYCLQYCKEYYMLYKAPTTPPPPTTPTTKPPTTTDLEMTSAGGEESTVSADTVVIVVLVILLVAVTSAAVALACNYRHNLYVSLQRVSRKYLRCASLEEGEPEEIELRENVPLDEMDERMPHNRPTPDSVQCDSLPNPDSISH